MSSRALMVLFAARCVFGSSAAFAESPSLCGATVMTTGVVVTYESIITIPHSCYSYTTQTPRYSGCPTYSCPAHPDCVFQATTTTYVPPKDACCPTTGVTTIEGPCSTCQTGCKTEYVTSTVTYTTAGPTTDSAGIVVSKTTILDPILTPVIPPPPRIVREDPPTIGLGDETPCTTTIFKADEWNIGPTKTAYPWTTTATAYVDCGSCEFVVERNINGLGPVVHFTATYNDPRPTTTTDYLCFTPL